MFIKTLSIQNYRIFGEKAWELDDFNYESVTRFRKHVADPAVQPDVITFPEIVIDAWLTGKPFIPWGFNYVRHGHGKPD